MYLDKHLLAWAPGNILSYQDFNYYPEGEHFLTVKAKAEDAKENLRVYRVNFLNPYPDAGGAAQESSLSAAP